MGAPEVRIILKPYASSLPLAAFAFGTGNLLYAAYVLKWIPGSDAHVLAYMLLAFVAPLELGPSIVGFLVRDTGAATAFAIFGAGWIVQSVMLLVAQPPSGHTVAAFLFCLALSLIILSVVTWKGKPLLGVVLIVAILRTAAAAWSALSGQNAAERMTGYLGLALTALAFYAAAVFLEEDISQRLSPLTMRSGEARTALEGELKDQVSSIEKEAGVRKQL